MPDDANTKLALLDAQLQSIDKHLSSRADRSEERFERDLATAKAELSGLIEQWRKESSSSIDRVRGELSSSIKDFEQRVERQFGDLQKHTDTKFQELRKESGEHNSKVDESIKKLTEIANENKTETAKLLAEIDASWKTIKTIGKIALPIAGLLGTAIGWLIQKSGLFH